MKIGFDNNKYLKMQSEHIRERINQFGDKLYLEFGGKLFDDYHASRVLPGFAPDSKLRMLLQLADQAEIVIVISAADIEKNKVRSDLGITYDVDVLRLIQSFTDKGLYVGSVVITHYSGQNTADVFKHKLESMGIKVKMITLKPNVHSLLSPRRDREAEKWQPAFPSSTTRTNAASRLDMPNLRPSRSGISR